MAASAINIIEFLNYRLFLERYIQKHYLDKGKGYRAFSKNCGISSPNYFQQIISERKNMSVQMAERIVMGMQLSESQRRYFVTLVKLDLAKEPERHLEVLKELKGLAMQEASQRVKDESFRAHWINQVIWTLAHLPDFHLETAAIREAIRGAASIDAIEESIRLLQKRNYIRFDSDRQRWVPENLQIESDNDVRDFNLRSNHFRFLQMAQHRLADHLSEREFQGLTIAIPRSKLPLIKSKMRAFILEMNKILDGSSDADLVVRLQLASFIVADSARVTRSAETNTEYSF